MTIINTNYLRSEPGTHLLLITLIVMAAYQAGLVIDESALVSALNLIGPFVMGSALVAAIIKLIKSEPLSLWTPYLWFLGATVVFYSLGPLVYVMGSESVLAYLDATLPINVDSTDVLQTNLLNSIGLTCLLLGFMGAKQIWRGPMSPKRTYALDISKIKIVCIWFLVAGGAIQFGLVVPWQFRVYEIVLPGIVIALGNMYLFGLVAFSYLIATDMSRAKVMFYTLWLTQIIVSLLLFSKTSLLMAILMPLLGRYLAVKRLSYLVFTAAIVLLTYMLAIHFVHYGRDEVAKLSEGTNRATFEQRMTILEKWISGDALGKDSAQYGLSKVESGWSRLSYVNVQTYAMNSYDNGGIGTSLQTVAIVLVPRILWPDKPLTVTLAKDFYELVSGNRGETHLGLGIYAEGYWNYGWAGVILLSIFTGSIFWVISSWSIYWMKRMSLEYLPGIFIGINMGGIGITDFFVNSIIGGGGIMMAYSLAVSMIIKVVSANKTA